VQQELVKTMQQVAKPSRAFTVWRDSGALAVLVPSLATVSDVALATIDQLRRSGDGRVFPQRTVNRVAALFLDCTPVDARAAMTALRFSKHEINWVSALVRGWEKHGGDIERALMSDVEPSDASVRRWVAGLGRLHATAFIRVAAARWCAEREAGHGVPPAHAVPSLFRRFVRARFAAIEIGDLAIGGDELRAAGIPPGPLYAKILDALLERVLEAPARNTPEALLADLPDVVAGLRGTANSPPQH
jgi:hypothetical protein